MTRLTFVGEKLFDNGQIAKYGNTLLYNNIPNLANANKGDHVRVIHERPRYEVLGNKLFVLKHETKWAIFNDLPLQVSTSVRLKVE